MARQRMRHLARHRPQHGLLAEGHRLGASARTQRPSRPCDGALQARRPARPRARRLGSPCRSSRTHVLGACEFSQPLSGPPATQGSVSRHHAPSPTPLAPTQPASRTPTADAAPASPPSRPQRASGPPLRPCISAPAPFVFAAPAPRPLAPMAPRALPTATPRPAATATRANPGAERPTGTQRPCDAGQSAERPVLSNSGGLSGNSAPLARTPNPPQAATVTRANPGAERPTGTQRPCDAGGSAARPVLSNSGGLSGGSAPLARTRQTPPQSGARPDVAASSEPPPGAHHDPSTTYAACLPPPRMPRVCFTTYAACSPLPRMPRVSLHNVCHVSPSTTYAACSPPPSYAGLFHHVCRVFHHVCRVFTHVAAWSPYQAPPGLSSPPRYAGVFHSTTPRRRD